ncbi:MAG: hypothetical protein ACPGVO_10740 [Spirulinaceae cyanobacterium]
MDASGSKNPLSIAHEQLVQFAVELLACQTIATIAFSILLEWGDRQQPESGAFKVRSRTIIILKIEHKW